MPFASVLVYLHGHHCKQVYSSVMVDLSPIKSLNPMMSFLSL